MAFGWLLLAAPASFAGTHDTWFFGGGFESPRRGSDYYGGVEHRTGPSFEAGYDHTLEGASGILMRVTGSRFPARVVTLGAGGMPNVVSATHTLVTLAGGPRFRRRDLAFSPFFDLGFGLGFVHATGVSVQAPYRRGRADEIDWVWTWGGGLAWRWSDRVGFFAAGHFDTVPQGYGSHMWTGSLRAGVEVAP
jgi:hypothetical protein